MKEKPNYADLSAILNVLAQLDLIAFVRCSAVCKAWQAASQKVHHTTLYVVTTKGVQFPPEGLVGVVRWLQVKNRAGCLDSLQRFLVNIFGDDDCTAACHEHRRLQLFSQSVAALAGSWRLRRFMLILHSPLDIAVPMLPPSLRHLVLELRTDILPGTVALSMFQGLKELQKLELMLVSIEEQAVVVKRQKTAGFIVDAQFNALTYLKLSPWRLRAKGQVPEGPDLSG